MRCSHFLQRTDPLKKPWYRKRDNKTDYTFYKYLQIRKETKYFFHHNDPLQIEPSFYSILYFPMQGINNQKIGVNFQLDKYAKMI